MENNIEQYVEDNLSDGSGNGAVVQAHLEKPVTNNPYPNGRARAFIDQMLKNKKEHQEAFTEELNKNPALRKKFDELAKRNKT